MRDLLEDGSIEGSYMKKRKPLKDFVERNKQSIKELEYLRVLTM